MITITGVTSQQFGGLESKLAATHQATITPFSANSGTIEGHGVAATFAYAPASQVLTVEMVHHPFFVSESTIEANLRKALGLP